MKYRQRGSFDVAHRQPARDGRREAPRRPRRAVPQLALHPVHVERQRRGDGRSRASSPRDIGVDRLCWELTDHPENAYSRRFVPGAPDFDAIRHEIWDDNNLGNAIPGATPRARHRRADVPRACRRCRLPGIAAADGARRPARRGPDARPQPVDAPVPGARRPTAAASSGSARSSATPTGTLHRSRLRARRGCPQTLEPGATGGRPDHASRPSSSRDAIS